jgi:hypothetical protein
MKRPIQISIPAPCHENWDAMTPADKGRFCASCQKNVIDFTNSSDREIAESFRQNNNLCGRFREDQLERNLIIPKKKSTIWAAASAAVISLITAGNTKLYAQEKSRTEFAQNTNKKENPVVHPEPFTISWTVKDGDGNIIKGAKISIIGTDKKTVTDANGNFSLTVNTGDIIKIKHKEKKTKKLYIYNRDYETITQVTLLTRKEEKRIIKGSPRYF